MRELSAIFTGLQVGMYAIDAQHRIVSLNPRACDLLGYAEADLLGQPAHATLHFRHPDGTPYPAESCPLTHVVEAGQPATSSSDIFVRADGFDLPVAWVSAPVRRDDGTRGAVVVFWDLVEQSRLAEQLEAARAVERRQAFALEASTARLALLAELSSVLGSTLDASEALRRLARLVVPRFADWCVVDLLREDGTVERVAVEHPEIERFPVKLGPLPAVTAASRGSLAQVLSGSPGLVVSGDTTREPSPDPLDREQATLFRELGARTVLVAPLRARHRVLGAMTWVRTGETSFDEVDRQLAIDIGVRAGLVLDNARLFAVQSNVAETLQRSLLTRLPDVEHLRLAARYHPAHTGAEIGGDWYDAFLLPDGIPAVVIGDVVGHDLEAAARMGQVRNIVRGIAYDRREPPSEVLRRVDLAVTGLGAASMASAIFGTVERDTSGQSWLHWSNAGHPAPLLVQADGVTHVLEHEADLLLGIAPDETRHDAVLPLPPGSTVLFYTDGLVETRTRSLESGMTKLRRALSPLAGAEVEELCDRLISSLLTGDEEDDIAILALRVPGSDNPS